MVRGGPSGVHLLTFHCCARVSAQGVSLGRDGQSHGADSKPGAARLHLREKDQSRVELPTAAVAGNAKGPEGLKGCVALSDTHTLCLSKACGIAHASPRCGHGTSSQE